MFSNSMFLIEKVGSCKTTTSKLTRIVHPLSGMVSKRAQGQTDPLIHVLLLIAIIAINSRINHVISIYMSIHPSIHLSIYPSINQIYLIQCNAIHSSPVQSNQSIYPNIFCYSVTHVFHYIYIYISYLIMIITVNKILNIAVNMKYT